MPSTFSSSDLLTTDKTTETCRLPLSDSDATLRSTALTNGTNLSGYGSVASLIHRRGKKKQKHGI